MKNIQNMNQYRFQDTFKINNKGHLEIGGLDTIDLADKYDTPLLVFDLTTIRQKIQQFKNALESYKGKSEISYASKAFSSVAMYQVMKQENIAIDVVSGGELYIAQQAGFPAERINFHGNNKSISEMIAALDYGIGHFIVDNFYELDMLKQLTSERQQEADVLIRVTPGVEADTHKHILTGNVDSKFGFDLQSGQAEQAVKAAMNAEYLNLKGIHLHIGSQIFDTESYALSLNEVLKFIIRWKDDFDFQLDVLNIGGGFGIQHTPEEAYNSAKNQLETITQELMNLLDKYELAYPELWIEPGRSVMGEAGTTIYDIGSEKKIPGVRDYVSIDGGMADNIRPAFYDAKYFGMLANRMEEEADTVVSIAGKACESGDMLIWDLPLPQTTPGDKLAIFNTGAYTFAMASNYNRLTRPAVVFVENGEDFLAIRREIPEDFMRFEQHLPTENK